MIHTMRFNFNTVRFGFCKEGGLLFLVQQWINSLTHIVLREDSFPLTLTLSPIGERGKSGTDLMRYGY